jgi:hypothetical protein
MGLMNLSPSHVVYAPARSIIVGFPRDARIFSLARREELAPASSGPQVALLLTVVTCKWQVAKSPVQSTHGGRRPVALIHR